MRYHITDRNERGRYVSALWEASKRGLITWDSCQQAQAQSMPRCAHCERPSIAEHNDQPICLECWKERHR